MLCFYNSKIPIKKFRQIHQKNTFCKEKNVLQKMKYKLFLVIWCVIASETREKILRRKPKIFERVYRSNPTIQAVSKLTFISNNLDKRCRIASLVHKKLLHYVAQFLVHSLAMTHKSGLDAKLLYELRNTFFSLQEEIIAKYCIRKGFYSSFCFTIGKPFIERNTCAVVRTSFSQYVFMRSMFPCFQ